MKKTKTLYWIIIGLFSGFMLFSSVPDILNTPDAVVFMSHLGYPAYFTPFIGVAKVLGIIAILIPGYYRVKEWAFAGLAFDLIGAIYSIIATDGIQLQLSFMLLPIIFLVWSYVLYHRNFNPAL